MCYLFERVWGFWQRCYSVELWVSATFITMLVFGSGCGRRDILPVPSVVLTLPRPQRTLLETPLLGDNKITAETTSGSPKPDRATAKARLGRRKTDRITTIKITSFWLTNARKPKKYWIVECPQLLYNCVKLKMSDLHSRLWEAYLEYSFMHALRNYSLQLMSNYCHSFPYFVRQIK